MFLMSEIGQLVKTRTTMAKINDIIQLPHFIFVILGGIVEKCFR